MELIERDKQIKYVINILRNYDEMSALILSLRSMTIDFVSIRTVNVINFFFSSSSSLRSISISFSFSSSSSIFFFLLHYLQYLFQLMIISIMQIDNR